MSKLLLSALVLAVVVAPTVQAQGHEVSIEIRDLEATAVSNGTQMSIPFNVTATVSGAAPCFASGGGGASYTITLAAELVNSTGNSTFVNVNPRSHTIAGPVLLPAPGGQAQRTTPATLIVSAGPYAGDSLEATVKVTASFASSAGGCAGATPAPASSDEADFRATFLPVRGFGASEAPGNEMPGPSLALLLLAFVAAAIVTRRVK